MLISICWQPDRKGGAQIPGPRAQRVMNEGCIYLYFSLASPFPDQLHVTASWELEQEVTLLFFSQALVPRTPVSTEAGACLNFTSLERSWCLGQVLPLITAPPPAPFCHSDYALHKFENTIQTVFGANGTLWVVQIPLLFKLFYIVIHPSLLTKSYIEGQSIKEI